MNLRDRLFGPKRARIDPFTVGEPWRRLVQDALAAETEFRDAVRRLERGPLRERMDEISQRVSAGVAECWQVGQAGHALSKARGRLDLADLQRQLAATDASGQEAVALQSQIDAATRMDAAIAETRDRLRLVNARLDEAVTRAIELSVSSATDEQLSQVDADVVSVTSEVEALRQGLDEVRRLGTNPS